MNLRSEEVKLMELIKRCPVCGEENPASEVICRVCVTNLSSASPVPRHEHDNFAPQPIETPETPAGDVTFAERPVLTFLRVDGRGVPAMDGTELGRSGECAELFGDVKTVSRRHARVTHCDGGWMIEDIGSTNGTWVNGRRLEQGQPCSIVSGDIVKLSLSCELRVLG